MRKPRLASLGVFFTALWIFGGASVFYVRLTSVFYHANKRAIHQAFATVAEYLGMGL